MMDGFRCAGHMQHCIFPEYMSENYHGGKIKICKDYSDQIFPIDSLCNATKYVLDYCSRFCSTPEDMKICEDPQSWIQKMSEEELAKNHTFYKIDPHNCQLSCSMLGPNCQACTSNAYMF